MHTQWAREAVVCESPLCPTSHCSNLLGAGLKEGHLTWEFPLSFSGCTTNSNPCALCWPPKALSDLHFHPVPLVSKICPSDTYKVWKSGQNLRVDTTLLGFDHMTWQRGNRSFVFRGQGQSGSK